MNEPSYHETVLLSEAVSQLHIKKQALYIDGTLGTGGHALEILRLGGKVLGIDMDSKMVGIARQRLQQEFNDSDFKLEVGNFCNMEQIASKHGWNKVSGILLDLGVSNLHLKTDERGFSFGGTEMILDMRLNPEVQGVRANDLLNALREDQLIKLFSEVMERGPSRWVAKRVIEERRVNPINTVGDFLKTISGLNTGKIRINEATLPFLALRIAVNGELENLKATLPIAYSLLESGGRLVVITFHSAEEDIVKEFAQKSKLIVPGTDELNKNLRARSAKMRVITKN